MICSKCGAEVPDNKLVCKCFLVACDNEIESRALAEFNDSHPIFMTSAPSSGYHLLPIDGKCITLCRKKRVGHPETRRIYPNSLIKAREDLIKAREDWCRPCLQKLYQSANAGLTQPAKDTPVERQQQKGKP